MKSLSFYSLIVLFVAAFSMTSCNKDDDNSSSSENGFTLDGTSYDLGRGFIEDWGANGNGSFDFDVTVVSDGITLNTGNGTLTGTGNFVYLDLNTSSESGLVDGTYTFSSNRDALTFVAASIGTDFDLDAQAGTVILATGGTVDLDVNGNTVTIDFTLETPSGTVVGNYSGSLTEF